MHYSLKDTFRSMRHYNFRLWFIGQGISLVGTWMQTMAQQVLVYRLTGSAASLGIINFIGFIPLIPLSLWSGSISDRFPRRKIILFTQTSMLIQALILGVLAWTGTVQVWHVYLLSFFLGISNAIDLPARQAFTADLVEGGQDLTNAIGLNSAMFNGARALGPALAGLVVAAVGEGPAFIINGLSFVAVIISLMMMHDLPILAKPEGKSSGTVAHMAEGLKYARSQTSLLVLMSLVAISAFLSMPYSTLAPVFANQVLGQSAQPVVRFICEGPHRLFTCQSPQALPLGIMLTVVGIGAVIGALMVASLPPDTSRGRMLTIGNLGFPLLLIGFSVSRSFLLSLLLLTGVGVMFVWQNALANTLVQLTSPDFIRGRVMALYTMTFQSFMRLGALQAGFMSDWIGPQLSVGLGAAISLIYGVWVAVRHPAVRKL